MPLGVRTGRFGSDLAVDFASFLRRLDRNDEAAAAYRDALALTMNAADRAFLERRLAEVVGS